MTRKTLPLEQRTIGVLERDDERMQRGYTLISAGRETYLIDEDGRLVHEWRSLRNVFCAYLKANGNLLRDGSENIEAPCFQAGGASGFVEEVTWDNEPVWSFSMTPYTSFLSHHDLEILPNGNVLCLVWERKTKEQAIAAGRRPELIPDGEVWNNLVVELEPDGQGSAKIVWQWSVWDHLVQDFDPKKENFGNVAEHPELIDINFCPVGGKTGCRNREFAEKGEKGGGKGAPNPSGLEHIPAGDGKTGEKDWLHINAVSYDAVRKQIVMSVNIASEFVVIDHELSTEEARGHTGGRYGCGGDILYRFGNPQAARRGTRMEQALFCQHSVQFLRGVPGDGNILLFNNGRYPDRHWSSVDEFRLPEVDGASYAASYTQQGQAERVWTFGPPIGRRNSFYCTHISGCQRLPNGNTLVTMGPQGTLVEVTPDGDEVWRYVSPIAISEGAVSMARQGTFRTCGRFSLFFGHRYLPSHPAFTSQDGTQRVLVPGRHLEA